MPAPSPRSERYRRASGIMPPKASATAERAEAYVADLQAELARRECMAMERSLS
jgi:hypothetical protein